MEWVGEKEREGGDKYPNSWRARARMVDVLPVPGGP